MDCENELLISFGFDFDIITPYNYLSYYENYVNKIIHKTEGNNKNKQNLIKNSSNDP